MADKSRQQRYKEMLRAEPLRSRLLNYADRRGITGNTYADEDKETFRLMETYDRVAARKIFESLGERFRDCGLEDRVDGIFTTGGTECPVEIKARLYDCNSTWAWVIDPEKYYELIDVDGWLMYLWIDAEDPFSVEWALWDVPNTDAVDVGMTCSKSVAREGAGNKNKIQKGFMLNDAVITGATYLKQ